jgi:Family of unknown function (DUF5681)
MPDLDLIKQAEQGLRDRRGRFSRGQSGNPVGRPRGCRDNVDRAARLLLAGEGEAADAGARRPVAKGWSESYNFKRSPAVDSL